MRGKNRTLSIRLIKFLDPTDYSIDSLLSSVEGCKARELVQQYVRRKPNAVRLVHRLLAEAGESMETFMAKALAEAFAKTLDQTERIDRLMGTSKNCSRYRSRATPA